MVYIYVEKLDKCGYFVTRYLTIRLARTGAGVKNKGVFMPRRERTDSIHSLVSSQRIASQKGPILDWPAHIKIDDSLDADVVMATYTDVFKGRSAAHWKPHHASIAAHLALLMAEQQKLTELLLRTGSIVKGKNGHASRSPVLDSLSMISSLIGQSQKQLGLVGL